MYIVFNDSILHFCKIYYMHKYIKIDNQDINRKVNFVEMNLILENKF